MPTYEYPCEKCKKNFDVFQSMKDDAFTICPEKQCLKKTWGKGKVKRLLGTGAGLIFKGSGFYITDYRSEGYKAAAKKESSGGSDSGGSKEKKESKTPAKSTESKSNSKPKKDS
jgi:putative FmdB family regulatory protein